MRLPNNLSRRKLYRRSVRRELFVLVFGLAIAWAVPALVFADPVSCPPGTTLASGTCYFNGQDVLSCYADNCAGINYCYGNSNCWGINSLTDYGVALSSFVSITFGDNLRNIPNYVLSDYGPYYISGLSFYAGQQDNFTSVKKQAFINSLVSISSGVVVPGSIQEVQIVNISSSTIAALTPGYFGHMNGGDISFWLGITMGLVIIVGYKTGGMK